MFDFIDNAQANMYANNNRTPMLEAKMNPRRLGTGGGSAQPQVQPQVQPQSPPAMDPMANVNAQRGQQVPERQAPSRTDMDGYVGFLKRADVAKDYMSANQPVPKSLGRSLNRTQDSFQTKYPSFQDADLQNRSADYLSSFGYRR